MIIRLSIAFLILLSISGYSSVSNAQIPAEAKAEIALTQAINEAENRQYEAAAVSLADYRKHTSDVPPSVQLLDAQVHYFKGDFEVTYGKIAAYFNAADKSDTGYSTAVELAVLLKDFELPHLVSQVTDEMLKENPRLAMKQIRDQGYRNQDIQALADIGNPKAMYLTAVGYFQNAEQTEGKQIAAEYTQAGEIYLQIACDEGLNRACIAKEQRVRSLLNEAWENVASENLDIDISQKRRAKYTHAFRDRAVYYYLNLLVSQKDLSEGYQVCLGGEVYMTQSARLVEGKGSTRSTSIIPGVDANYDKRETSLQSLYQASVRPVSIEKEHSFGVDVTLGSWNPSRLKVQASLGATDNLVLLRDTNTTKLRTAIEDFVSLCNILGPELVSGFAPLKFVNSSASISPISAPVETAENITSSAQKVIEAEPIKRVPPVMPERFLQGNHSGYCKMQFDLSKQGHPENVQALVCTSELLKRASTEAVQQFRYTPKTVDGVPVKRSNVQTTITFALADGRGRRLPYPDGY